MALVVSRFRNGLGYVKHVYDVVYFSGAVVFYVFKMKVKVTHKECFVRHCRSVKEVGKLIEKGGVRECFLFAGWRAVDTESVG